MDRFTVKLRDQQQYLMPSICCACGAPSGNNTLKKTGSNWSGKNYATLAFPLCDTCHQTYRTGIKKARLGCLYGLIPGALLCIGGFAISNWMENNSSDFANMLLSVVLVIAVIAVAAGFVVTMVMNRQPAFKQVNEAVAIKNYRQSNMFSKGEVTFVFRNQPFALLFQQMNL